MGFNYFFFIQLKMLIFIFVYFKFLLLLTAWIMFRIPEIKSQHNSIKKFKKTFICLSSQNLKPLDLTTNTLAQEPGVRLYTTTLHRSLAARSSFGTTTHTVTCKPVHPQKLRWCAWVCFKVKLLPDSVLRTFLN